MSTPKTSSPLLRVSDDVLLEICDAVKAGSTTKRKKKARDTKSLKALALCNHRFRRIVAPELMRHASIDRPANWLMAQALLDSMLQCDHVGYYTESLVINLTSSSLEEAAETRGVVMPATFMDDVVRLLRGMPKLKDLALRFTPGSKPAGALIEAIKTSDLLLPTVKSLNIDSEMHLLIHRCPNLESITSRAATRWYPRMTESETWFLDSCAEVPHLRHFEMRRTWDTSALEAVHKALPNLASLAMTGSRYDSTLRQFISLLGQFQNLKVLAIANAWQLSIGFHPPECGNPYMEEGGDELAKRVEEEHAAAKVKAAQMCFGKCKGLETLWIGDDTRVTVVRSIDGGVGTTDVVDGLQRPLPMINDSIH